jgi:hypothetical protein
MSEFVDLKAEMLRIRAARIEALEAENQKLRAKVNAIETASDAIIRFHNGPAEAKRPDIFLRLLKALAIALDEPPPKSADTKAAIESLEQLYSND